MDDQIIRIKSISQIHKMLNLEPPKHPLITVLRVKDLELPEPVIGLKITTDLYSISLKGGHCGMTYGRNTFDFEQGVLMFMAPNQVISKTSDYDGVPGEDEWMLMFHPDLIRKFPLGDNIDKYSFFSYDTHEALHLSEDEKSMMNMLVSQIKNEYEQRIDNHSQHVLVASIELLLSYSSRYYERQFNTRSSNNKDVVSQVERIIKNHFNSEKVHEEGMITIQMISDQVHLSPNYLSDLLKKETGRSAKDHINDYIVEKAKNLLLSSGDSVSEVAYNLGFNYPHYFSRMFKSKTGITPQKYREIN